MMYLCLNSAWIHKGRLCTCAWSSYLHIDWIRMLMDHTHNQAYGDILQRFSSSQIKSLMHNVLSLVLGVLWTTTSVCVSSRERERERVTYTLERETHACPYRRAAWCMLSCYSSSCIASCHQLGPQLVLERDDICEQHQEKSLISQLHIPQLGNPP